MLHFRNRQVAFDIIVATVFTILVTVGVNYAVRAYVLNRAEQNVENLILSHRGLHQYIQKVMHPAFYKAVADGRIANDYYAPEIFSSSFIVRTMHGLYNEELLKHQRAGIYYKLAAENPRNPVNKADAHEANLIALFNRDREQKHFSEVVTVDGKKYLYYAIPFLENTAACLQCHGKREDAPMGLQALYPGDGGFNEKVGRIRAIESIRAPLKEDLGFIGTALVVVCGMALSIIALFLFGKRLRAEVKLKTSRLKQELAARQKVENDLRVQAEELRVSEARHRNLVETSSDWIWEVDAQSKYTYASPRVLNILGYGPDEVLGRTPFDLMPEDEARRVQNVFQSIAAARKPFAALENINRHKDGRVVVLETSGVPVFAPDGTWLGYRGMDRDITERRAAEKVLRLHGAALTAAANAVVITDREGKVEWVNPAFTILSGWTLAEALGKNPRELVKSGQHDAAFYGQMWKTILAGNVWRGEVINRRKNGDQWTEEMTITPLRDSEGRIAHFIAIKQDITARKAVESQLLQAQRLEAVGTLASGIAHDLNNILAPMLMVSELLKGKLTDEEDRALLALLQREAQRGGDIIKQLLVYSRGLEGQRKIIQPRYVLREIMTMMRETFPREITFHQELSVDLWPVIADQTQLHQVVLNLCVNARDAMPNGGELKVVASNVTLPIGHAALQPTAKPGAYVLVAVCDSGHGIPPEVRRRIFDPFFTTKPLGKGTGLGLSTVLGIVQNHGGFVAVDSAPGRGSIFNVYWPAVPEEPASQAADPAVALASGNGQTILVVDDERNIREATRIALERHGYRVQLAVNGEDALTQYRRHCDEVSLVLTDVMMPVMNGVALVEALRALDPQLPIVATSGLAEMDKRSELQALAVTEVLSKPCNVATLLAAIQRQLTQR